MGPPKYKINQSIYILAQTTTYSTSFVSYSLAPVASESGVNSAQTQPKLRWFLSTLFIITMFYPVAYVNL